MARTGGLTGMDSAGPILSAIFNVAAEPALASSARLDVA
jgi:hypothetical protein